MTIVYLNKYFNGKLEGAIEVLYLYLSGVLTNLIVKVFMSMLLLFYIFNFYLTLGKRGSLGLL